MAQRKIHGSNAERQAAYRERQKRNAAKRNVTIEQQDLFEPTAEQKHAQNTSAKCQQTAEQIASQKHVVQSSDVLMIYKLYPRKVGRRAAIPAIEAAIRRLPKELREEGNELANAGVPEGRPNKDRATRRSEADRRSVFFIGELHCAPCSPSEAATSTLKKS